MSGGQTKTEYAEVDISALEELPDARIGLNKIKWSAEKDAALLKYWPIKSHDAVARILGHATGTCLRRYRELTS